MVVYGYEKLFLNIIYHNKVFHFQVSRVLFVEGKIFEPFFFYYFLIKIKWLMKH